MRMLIELSIFVLLGILAGTFTGLIPGIHINLVGTFLLSISAYLLTSVQPINLVIFIVAMAITHTFVDFIPSVFLGCPDTDTELSILPGHELLKKGEGYQAVMLTCYGSLIAILIIIIISIPSIIMISKIYYSIKKITPYFLMFISLFLISLERKRLSAFFVFLLSGTLGIITLNLENLNQPLLPLLTGLFGSSNLILSIKNKTVIPEQKITKVKTKIFAPIFGAFLAAPICSFLPGLGSGQAAIIGNNIINRKSKNNQKDFLLLLGATNTLVMGFSFLSLYAISRTRTGAAVVIKELIDKLTYENLLLILTTIAIAGLISFFITHLIAKTTIKKITKVNYIVISVLTISILSMIVLLISKILGFFVLIISTLTGIYCISLKVRRTQMMGCLLLPTIIWYLIN